jgi:GR25 family glycosyltransferase involved in LPS biosynthesis
MLEQYIPIKVISLERSIKRREIFSEYNKDIKFDFISAIDGEKLEKIDNNIFSLPLAFPSMGVYGCALSHLLLWDFSINKNTPLTNSHHRNRHSYEQVLFFF